MRPVLEKLEKRALMGLGAPPACSLLGLACLGRSSQRCLSSSLSEMSQVAVQS